MHDAHVTWSRFLGDADTLTAEASGLEMVRGMAMEDDVHFTTARATLTSGRGTFGPWRVDAERTPRSGRVRIGFDAMLPDGPSALFVQSESGVTATVRIARTPLARLGIPAAAVGLAVDEATQLEASIQLSRPLPNRVAADIDVTVHDARLAGGQTKQDLLLTGQLAGDPTKPLDVIRGALAFGPLRANAAGAVTLFDRGFRVDLKWTAPPLPCGVLLNKESSKQASAAGLLGFDTRHPGQATFVLTSQATCGLVIFPSQ